MNIDFEKHLDIAETLHELSEKLSSLYTHIGDAKLEVYRLRHLLLTGESLDELAFLDSGKLAS